jgi:hypothetical protein
VIHSGCERRPPGWQWHFAPLCLQVAYAAVLFCLPLGEVLEIAFDVGS